MEDPLYEAWHRPRGSTWLRTVTYAPGQPSLQWTSACDASATDNDQRQVRGQTGREPAAHDHLARQHLRHNVAARNCVMPIRGIPRSGYTFSRALRASTLAASDPVRLRGDSVLHPKLKRSEAAARWSAPRPVYATAVKAATVAGSGLVLAWVVVLCALVVSGACGGEGSSDIRFDADYETGDITQWTWGAQCANTGGSPKLIGTRGSMVVVEDIVAKGSHAARIDLPATSAVNACEGIRKRTVGTGHGSPPKEEWYALSVRFPTNLHTNSWGMTFGQPNYQSIHGSPLHFFVYGPNDASREPFHARLVAQAGECKPIHEGGRGCQWSNGLGSGRNPMRIIPNSRFRLGVWHDLLVHVVWTTNGAEALYEGWHRPRGGRWLQTVNYAPGEPSVQWRPGDTVDPSDTTTDKFGAYRGANSQALSIWHDNICVATTRVAAESCF
jgi:hypothetical protein